MLRPAALKPGDRVRVIAPSAPFDRTLLRRGVAWLGERYRVVFEAGLFDTTGFLAGNDERRLGELNRALGDPETRAVIAARGGYGLTRIVHRADLAPLLVSAKWLIGFSDFTALHVEAARAGLVTLHASHAAELGRGDARARETWLAAVEDPARERRHTGLSPWHGGVAEGPLYGGNLTVLFTCAAAGRLRIPTGALLVLEDVTETSYRIDRMLTALLVSGALDRVAGVLVGDFTDCASGKFEVPAEDVLRERLGQLGVPVLAGLPFGHGDVNTPLPLGTPARLDAVRGELSLNLA